MKHLIGQTLDRYQIVTLLGQGGMGTVYRARDTVLKRDVALKVMHAHLAAQPMFKARFVQEAQAAANLDHPNIVKVFDFKEIGDLLYIVMEFIGGGDLKQMLQRVRNTQQQLPLPDTIDLVKQLAYALDYAHRQGVLHRDIKPANIMLKPDLTDPSRPSPVITDMGLAKLTESSIVTQTGESMGTPAYMSPEQALGNTIGPATDIYALGVLFYELAVGRLPYLANTLSEAFHIHHKGTPPPAPRSLRPDLPQAVEAVILQALANDPARRFTTGRALADALEAVRKQIITTTTPATMAEEAISPTSDEQTVIERPTQMPLEQPVEALPLDEDKLTGIQIQEPSGGRRFVKVKRGSITVGRDSDNTIALPADLRASRHHARIEFDGVNYKVTDLNSRNGTFLGNSQLLAGIPERWTTDKHLRIGDHLFQIQHKPAEGMPPVILPALSGVAGVTPAGRTQFNPASLALTLQPTRKRSIQPGNFQLVMTNHGETTLQLRLSAKERSNECLFTFDPPQIMVGSGAESLVDLQIRLAPAVVVAADKSYPFAVTVADAFNPKAFTQVQGEWIYEAESIRFEMELHPKKYTGSDQGEFALQLINHNDAGVIIKLTARDKDDACTYAFNASQVAISRGQMRTVKLTIQAKAALRQEKSRSHRFTIFAITTEAPLLNQQIEGEWVQTPNKQAPLDQAERASGQPAWARNDVKNKRLRPLGSLGWRFVFFWTLASIPVVILNGVQLWYSKPSAPFSTRAILVFAIYGAILGLVMGFLQWLVLRRRIGEAGWWIINSLGVWSVSSSLMGTILLYESFYFSAAPVVKILIFSTIQGVTVGAIQWIMLRHHISGWLNWIGATIVGLALGPLFMVNATDHGSFAGAIFGAIIFGALTGAALAQLLAQSARPIAEQA